MISLVEEDTWEGEICQSAHFYVKTAAELRVKAHPKPMRNGSDRRVPFCYNGFKLLLQFNLQGKKKSLERAVPV